MIDNKTYSLKDIIKTGLLSSLIALSLSVIGFITLLNKRELVAGILSLGHVFLFSPLIAFAYLSAGRAKDESKHKILGSGFLIGFLTSIPLLILALIEHFFDIRQFLVNVSPDLMEMLLFLSP